MLVLCDNHNCFYANECEHSKPHKPTKILSNRGKMCTVEFYCNGKAQCQNVGFDVNFDNEFNRIFDI